MAIDLQQIGKRFRFYTNLKELDTEQLKSLTGSDGKVLNCIISGQNYLLDDLVAILQHFHDLNPQWLIYGEGSMFKPMSENGSCPDHQKGCLKKDKSAYLKQMQSMLQELDAAEVAQGHEPDLEALKAKLEQIKAAE
ncbi:hypothetical protein [Pontibacter liquoris]|uniref:hypothetical protein n=1 Tax=Pontibacter liquoris TaxID=2905677 RepID=UPI001FA6BFB7|nr:hypothetical protein [Pontibacter liquoris]